MTYSAVMRLAEERPELLPLVQAAHGIAVEYDNHFSGSSVFSVAPHVAPNLRGLSRRGILVKTGQARQGHRVYYGFADLPGAERALREFRLV